MGITRHVLLRSPICCSIVLCRSGFRRSALPGDMRLLQIASRSRRVYLENAGRFACARPQKKPPAADAGARAGAGHPIPMCSSFERPLSTSWSRTPAAANSRCKDSPSPAGARTPPATLGSFATCGDGLAARSFERASSPRSMPAQGLRGGSSRARAGSGAATTTHYAPEIVSRRKRYRAAGLRITTARDAKATSGTTYADVLAPPPRADALTRPSQPLVHYRYHPERQRSSLHPAARARLRRAPP